MKFRPTYEGELRSTPRDPKDNQLDPLAQHKWKIRKEFHFQLKQLWAVHPMLKSWKGQRAEFPTALEYAKKQGLTIPKSEPMINIMGDAYVMYNHRFVPLARKDLNLICWLDILFLRRDVPGSALDAGDIDNRVKTLIDTLRMPRSPNEMAGKDVALIGNEPFHCLLEK